MAEGNWSRSPKTIQKLFVSYWMIDDLHYVCPLFSFVIWEIWRAKSSQLNDWMKRVVIGQTNGIPKISLHPYIPVALVTHLSSNYRFLKPALIKALTMTNKHALQSLCSVMLINWWGPNRVLIRDVNVSVLMGFVLN